MNPYGFPVNAMLPHTPENGARVLAQFPQETPEKETPGALPPWRREETENLPGNNGGR